MSFQQPDVRDKEDNTPYTSFKFHSPVLWAHTVYTYGKQLLVHALLYIKLVESETERVSNESALQTKTSTPSGYVPVCLRVCMCAS